MPWWGQGSSRLQGLQPGPAVGLDHFDCDYGFLRWLICLFFALVRLASLQLRWSL